MAALRVCLERNDGPGEHLQPSLWGASVAEEEDSGTAKLREASQNHPAADYSPADHYHAAESATGGSNSERAGVEFPQTVGGAPYTTGACSDGDGDGAQTGGQLELGDEYIDEQYFGSTLGRIDGPSVEDAQQQQGSVHSKVVGDSNPLGKQSPFERVARANSEADNNRAESGSAENDAPPIQFSGEAPTQVGPRASKNEVSARRGNNEGGSGSEPDSFIDEQFFGEILDRERRR